MHLEERAHYGHDLPAAAGHGPADHPRPPVAPPCVMVIFGASGDLTKRKLIPALFNLRRSGLLSDNFAVLGVARQPLSDEELRQRVDDDIAACDEPEDPDCQSWLLQRVHYLSGDITERATYEQIAARLTELGVPYLYYENTDGGHQANANLREAARRRTLEYMYLTQRLID